MSATHRFGLIERLSSPIASTFAAVVFASATVVALSLEAHVTSGRAPGAAWLEAAVPFASWWYALALWLVAAVALAHLVTDRDDAAASPLSLRATLPAALPDEVMERALRTLGRVRAGKGLEWLCEHGRSRRGARRTAAAAALVMTLTLGAWAHLRDVGVAKVDENGVTYGLMRALPSGFARFDLGADLQSERLSDTRYRVSLGRGADVYGRAELSVGDTLRAGDWSATLWGQQPGETPRALLLHVDGESAPRKARLGEPLKLDGELTLVALAFEPKRRVDGAAEVGPAVRVSWSRAGKPVEEGWLYAERADLDAKLGASVKPTRFVGYEKQPALVFKVVRGGTLWPLALAGLLALSALVSLLGPAHRRLRATHSESGWLVQVDGDATAESQTAALDRLLAQLRTEDRR